MVTVDTPSTYVAQIRLLAKDQAYSPYHMHMGGRFLAAGLIQMSEVRDPTLLAVAAKVRVQFSGRLQSARPPECVGLWTDTVARLRVAQGLTDVGSTSGAFAEESELVAGALEAELAATAPRKKVENTAGATAVTVPGAGATMLTGSAPLPPLTGDQRQVWDLLDGHVLMAKEIAHLLVNGITNEAVRKGLCPNGWGLRQVGLCSLGTGPRHPPRKPGVTGRCRRKSPGRRGSVTEVAFGSGGERIRRAACPPRTGRGRPCGSATRTACPGSHGSARR